MKIRSFRQLDAWNAAIELTSRAYDVAGVLPAIERFELASQIRRAAVSVPSNVAEGHASGLRNRYRHHVRIALGSLAEIETQMEVARRRGYVDDAGTRKLEEQIARTGQLLHGILRSLRRQALAALTAGAVSALVIVTLF